MSTTLNVTTLLLLVLGSNASNDVNTYYDYCMMWRDDLTTLFLKCKVPNFSIPVEFLHNETMETVKCFDHKREPFCTPNSKRVTFNQSAEFVTIVLEEEKFGNNLDGTWYCRQGESIKTTKVSISDGIAVDTIVDIKGIISVSEDGSSYVDVQCSSCREAHHSFAEFFYNGKTAASVWQNDLGNCFHQHFICTDDVCKCSKDGNSFSMRLQIKDNSKLNEIGCQMQFSDDFRNVLFAIFAYSNYNGTGFTSTDTILTILKEEEAVSTGKYSSNDKVSTTDLIIETKTPSIELDHSVINIIVPTAVMCVIVAAFLFFVISIHVYRKKEQRKLDREMSSIPLLHTAEYNQCKPCGTYIKVEYMCLDCRQLFCERCIKQYHDINEETKQHKSVNIEKIPEHFSVTMFNCSLNNHEHSLLQYICNNHKDVICKYCKSQKHSSCIVELISEMLPEETTGIMHALQCKIDGTETQILAFTNTVNRNVTSYKRQASTVQQQIIHSEETTIQIGKETHTMTNSQTRIKLSEIEINLRNEAEKVSMSSDELRKAVVTQRKLFKFVLEFGGNLHLYISAIQLDKTLNEIISELKDNTIQYKCMDITLLNGKNIIIKEVPLSEYSSRTPSMASRDFLDDMETDTNIRPTATIQPTFNEIDVSISKI